MSRPLVRAVQGRKNTPRVDVVHPELTAAQTRVLLALVLVYERDGRATVRSVAEQAGLSSPGSLVRHLRVLRRLGWVTWVDHRAGTLRPTVARIPWGMT